MTSCPKRNIKEKPRSREGHTRAEAETQPPAEGLLESLQAARNKGGLSPGAFGMTPTAELRAAVHGCKLPTSWSCVQEAQPTHTVTATKEKMETWDRDLAGVDLGGGAASSGVRSH